MTKITSYPSGTLNLNDYLIGTNRETQNVTRSYKVSEIVNTIIAAAPGSIGTVTSISTVSSSYINVTGGPITVTGTVGANISATGTTDNTTFLRGDNTWSLPGPTPNSISILSNGIAVAANVNSIDFTNGITATAANLSVTANVPGFAILVDSVIAGTAISVSSPTGGVTINNTGVTLAAAGGNITLSGGTGNVTVNTTANAGSMSGVNSGLGIATIANSATNPEIDIEFTGINNYISRSLDATVILPEDLLEFNELTVSNVKNVEIGDITPSILTEVKKYIDDADENKIKNTTDSYTSTEKALNMVSLTDAQYTSLVNAGTVNENTLYFILGASVSYTVNPIVTDNVTGDAGYTISTTPSSVSGVAGTPYTFTTTVNVQPGGSFSGTNPVVTTDTINSASGNPYNKAITVTGVYTAPLADSVRASLAISLDQNSSGSVPSSNLTSNLSNLTFSGNIAGNKDPLAYSTANPTFYGFTSAVAITDTNTYKFTTGPTVVNASGSLVPSSLNQDVTVTTYIHGTVALKTYTVDLVVVNNITITGTGAGTSAYNMDFESTGSQVQQSSITQAGGTISSAITGLNNTNTFGFGLNNLNWALPADYTWSVAPTVVISANTSPIAGANGSATATVSGTILYTAPAQPVDLTLKYQTTGSVDNPTGSIVFNTPATNSNITLSPLGDGTNTITVAANGPYDFGAITATLDTGYYFSSAFVANPAQPAGTAPTVDSDINSQLTGAVSVAQSPIPQVIQTTYSGFPTPNYTTTLTGSAPVGTGSGNINTVGSQTIPGNTFNIGDGQVLVNVTKSGSGTAIGPVTITWPDASQTTIAEGGTVGTQTKTVTIAQGASASVTINESIPVTDVTSTLILITSGITGTEFTNSGDESGDENVAAPGTTQSFSPNLVANTDYEFTSGPTYSGTGLSYTQPNIDGDETVNVTGVIASSVYDVVLGYENNIIGDVANYTISPADGTTIQGNVNSAYDFGLIIGIPDLDYQFSVGFNSTYFSGLPLAGTIPSGGGTATQKLTGTVVCTPYTITLAYANSISGGTEGVEYTLSPAAGSTRVGCVGTAYSFGTITATPASGYYFSTPFNASQTSLSLPIIGTIASGGGTASQNLTGVIALARATISVVQVAIPTTTAITYATSFAPGGSGATRTLTTTGTQSLSNSSYEYGNGSVTVTVNRTAPSSTAQDGGSITWILNGANQSTQSFSNGATISYSRTITGVTSGDTIQVNISEG